MKRTDILDTKSAREAIEILVADLRKYANFEFGQTANVLGGNTKQEARREALLFAADFIEKAL